MRRVVSFAFLLVLLLALLPFRLASAAAPLTWSVQEAAPKVGRSWRVAGDHFRGDLTGVAWGAGRWVAVGQNGRIQSSSDGEEWTFHDLGIEQDLVSITWSGEWFIAYGKQVESGSGCKSAPRCYPVVAVSADGLDWQVSYPPTEIIMGVIWGGGRFIAATFYNQFLTSTDGLTWKSTAGRPAFFDDMRYWNGEFVGVSLGDRELKLYSSADGQTWRYRPLPTSERGDWRLMEADGALVAYTDYVDFLLRSTDGKWWEQIPLPEGVRPSKIVGAPGNWVALMNSSYSTFGHSKDLVHWSPTLVPPGSSGFRARDVAGHEGKFVAVGEGGAVAVLDTTQDSTCVQLYEDIPPEHPACVAVATYLAKPSVTKSSASRFHPERTVSRSEIAQMLVAVMGWRAGNPSTPVSFTDYKAGGKNAVGVAVAKGVMSGYADGTFRPREHVTRAQLIKIAVSAAGLKPGGSPGYADVAASAWYAGWVGAARSAKLVGKDAPNALWTEGVFDGDRLATRAEVVMILVNLTDRR